MTIDIKLVLAIGLCAVIGAVGWFLPLQKPMPLAVSPVGTTFGTAKIADVNWTPTTASATSTSVKNSDANDRFVKSVHYFCTGMGTNFFSQTAAGVSALVFQAATSSSASIVSNLPTSNYILSTNVSTSSDVSVLTSTSTPGKTATQEYLRWPAGSYIVFTANATSSTASCTIGVDYAGS